MDTMIYQYDNIIINILSELEYDSSSVDKTLKKYLPGLSAYKENLCKFKYVIDIKLKSCYSVDDRDGNVDILGDKIQVNINTTFVNGYLLLGILRSAIDYFMQRKDVFFLHGAGLKVKDEYILIFGKRADGKSTISKYLSKFGEVIHDERIGLYRGDSNISSNIPVINIEKLKYVVTPKILHCGQFKKWSILKHSLRYELYVELSESIRCCGSFEDNIVFQSIDNKEISKKRSLFCDTISNTYFKNSYFIEGTKEQICDFLVK